MLADQKSEAKRILGLDGLRALSVIAVFFHHTGGTLMKGGYIGVEVFFVLSGYLITSILCREKSKTGSIDFIGFYIRRARRLYPALILLLIAVAAYCAVYNKYNLTLETIPSLLYVMNWYRAFEWYDAVLTGHTWSLAIEEQFYLVWPLLLSLLIWLSPRKLPLFIFALILSIVAWRTYLFLGNANLARIYNGFDTHADALLVGSLLALVSTDVLRRVGLLWIPALVFLLAVLFSQEMTDFTLSRHGFGIVAVASAMVIAKVVSDQNSILVRVLSIKPLVWLGMVSYGFYLWHYPLIQVIMYGGHDPILGFYGSLAYPIPFLVGTIFLGTLLITSISWYLVEKPIISYAHKKISSRSPKIQAVS
ncbi:MULTISPECIES: acyltransferase [unclassified Pseudomonas]|uniref:acyltransferase family protein n=1 Tax=unclassified Pseudomonas TaxID=196821 RepID=UPI002A36EA60|nr:MULTISPECIES: acyltransferase [unclassified Pseudomonas]MDX9673114.1 acyltransferase [Pseudomonas sp. P8_250]WPN38343.1 acyltransferase [Pseudomonas sp. P8_139]WPN39855.1 acyltransferase [Pseudomonas sp. P8_229]